MKRIQADIAAGALARVYLLFGNEPYLIRLYAQKLIDAALPVSARSMNMTTLDAAAPASAYIDALETMPFMAERRLAVAKEPTLFAAKKGEEAADGKEAQILAEYLPDIPDGAVLLLTARQADKRTRLFKQIQKVGYCAELNTPAEKEIVDWLCRLAAKGGKTIARSAAAHLARFHDSMDALEQEMHKLLSYADDAVTVDHINALCAKPLEARIFDLTDAIAERRPAAALALYRDMLALREPPFMVLTMIARQFRLMLQCDGLKRLTNAEIAAKLGIKPFVAAVCLRQGKGFTPEALAGALKACLETDVAVKTGQIGDRMGVELLITRLTAHTKQQVSGG